MSADPFENTTTVKNILQHMISPKIVSDGATGYIVRTDLVHVHNIIFENGTSTENGTVNNPFTTQCGVSTDVGSSKTVYHSRVTGNSIIFASVMDSDSYSVTSVRPSSAVPGTFAITVSGTLSPSTRVGWFIAKF